MLDNEKAKDLYAEGISVGEWLILDGIAKKLYLTLNNLQVLVDGIDNGYCKLCKIGHREYDTRGITQKCENEFCFSHDINRVLDRYRRLDKKGIS